MENAYYKLLQSYLTKKPYTLDKAQSQIKYFVASGDITVEEAAELHALATVHALPDTSLEQVVAELQQQVADLAAKMGTSLTDEAEPEPGPAEPESLELETPKIPEPETLEPEVPETGVTEVPEPEIPEETPDIPDESPGDMPQLPDDPAEQEESHD